MELVQARAALLEVQLRLAKQTGERDQLAARAERVRRELREIREQLVVLGSVLAVFHALSASVQQRFLHAIEVLVSQGLQAVFGGEIQFTIKPEVRGKNIQLDFILGTPGSETDDIIGSRGGGVASVVGIILRVIVVRLLSGTQRQVVFLDEPLSHLSSEFTEPCGALLRRLADDLDIQIVLITHQPEFAERADVCYTAVATKNGTAFRRN